MKDIVNNTQIRKVKTGKPEKMTKQRQNFLEYYFYVDSESYMNAYASAVRAGFSHSYARVLSARSMPWIENVRHAMSQTVSTEELISLARKNIREASLGKLDKEGENHYRYKASEFVSSRADKDFTDKKLVDVTSAGLPLQEQLISALVKVYEE
jgi:hypothetical protein